MNLHREGVSEVFTLFLHVSYAFPTLFLHFFYTFLTLFPRFSDTFLTLFWRFSDAFLTLFSPFSHPFLRFFLWSKIFGFFCVRPEDTEHRVDLNPMIPKLHIYFMFCWRRFQTFPVRQIIRNFVFLHFSGASWLKLTYKIVASWIEKHKNSVNDKRREMRIKTHTRMKR